MVTILNNIVLCIWKLLRQILKVLIMRKILRALTDVNWTYFGDHFALYIHISNHYVARLKLLSCHISMLSQLLKKGNNKS